MTTRICHFSTVHRGVEIRIARKQLATLASQGYEAHLVIPATDAEVAEARSLGIILHPLPAAEGAGRLSRLTKRMAQAAALTREIAADLYHFHDPELIPLGLSLKRRGQRVIMDVHEDLATQILVKKWIHPLARRPISRVARRMELFGAARFDAVVVSVPHIATFFAPHARRVAVVGNFPFLDELAAPDDSVPWESRRHVAYVGSISLVRGLAEIVRAADLAEVNLEIAGAFANPRERDAVMQDTGWRRVRDHGWVGRQQIREVLSRSFVGLCTLHATLNHIHSEPIKMFEYMAAGVPVIASDIPAWRSFVLDTGSGLCVDPMDPAAIAEAIRFLRDHPEKAQEMGRNGRRAVMERYNWHAESAKLTDLYRAVLAG